jgi:cytochrome c oxidase subunit III
METLAQQRKRASKPLLWIGIGSIIMAFAGLTSGYVVSRTTLVANEQWLTFELPSAFISSTIAILLSSTVLWWGVSQIKKGNTGALKSSLVVTLILGAVFAVLQVQGWKQLIDEEIYFAGAGSNPAGSWVYAISVFHLAHLAGGVIALFVTLFKSLRGAYSADDYHGVTLLSIYWHFVDLLWVYLYVFLTLIR